MCGYADNVFDRRIMMMKKSFKVTLILIAIISSLVEPAEASRSQPHCLGTVAGKPKHLDVPHDEAKDANLLAFWGSRLQILWKISWQRRDMAEKLANLLLTVEETPSLTKVAMQSAAEVYQLFLSTSRDRRP